MTQFDPLIPSQPIPWGHQTLLQRFEFRSNCQIHTGSNMMIISVVMTLGSHVSSWNGDFLVWRGCWRAAKEPGVWRYVGYYYSLIQWVPLKIQHLPQELSGNRSLVRPWRSWQSCAHTTKMTTAIKSMICPITAGLSRIEPYHIRSLSSHIAIIVEVLCNVQTLGRVLEAQWFGQMYPVIKLCFTLL